MRLLCYGDSNTYGYDPQGIYTNRYDTCWCELLAQATGWEVINGGSNGRTIPVLDYRWIDTYLTKYYPVDRLVIMLGSNNILRGNEPERILQDMHRLLTYLRTNWPDLPITLLSPPPIIVWKTPFDVVLQAVTAGYRAMAAEMGLHFAETALWRPDISFDGTHFSEAGHRQFARAIQKELENLT